MFSLICSHVQSARIRVITLTNDFYDVVLNATYLASGVTQNFQNGGMQLSLAV